MESQTQLAGSLPVEMLRRRSLAFDESLLTRSELSSFQCAVATRLLGIAQRFALGSFSARVIIESRGGIAASTVLINFVPREERAAELTIYIERETTVSIGAGCETTFGLPHDVWDERAKDVLGFTEKIVSAIVWGKLREAIHYRGNIVVGCKSELDVDGVPISVDRTDVGGMLRALFRRRRKRELTYVAYT